MAATNHWIAGALTVAALALALAGCSSTPKTAARNPDDGRGSYRIGKPYVIDGKTYYPAEDFNYSETGIASWYGPGFHGRNTANGEVYDQEQVSAAHKTLPLPTIVRVTNLDNGRSVIARVNDRGPFVSGRIIDMSKGGAHELGLDQTGTARVRVEVMRRETEIVKAVAINGGGVGDQMAALSNPSSLPPSSPSPSSPPNVLDTTLGPVIASAPRPANAPPPSPPQLVSASQPIWSPGDPPPPKGLSYGPMVVSSDPQTPAPPAPPTGSYSSQVISTPIAPPPLQPQPPQAAWSKPVQSTPNQAVQLAPPPSTLGNQAAALPPPQVAPQVVSPPVVSPPVVSPPVVSPPPQPFSPSSAPLGGSGQIYVQAGAFSQFDNAEKVRVQLSQYGAASVSPVQANGRELYRVRLGPLASMQAADALRGQVLQAGYRDARVVND